MPCILSIRGSLKDSIIRARYKKESDMGTEIWIISLPLSDSILCLKIIHPPNFREEPRNKYIRFSLIQSGNSSSRKDRYGNNTLSFPGCTLFMNDIHCFYIGINVLFFLPADLLTGYFMVLPPNKNYSFSIKLV